MAAERRVEDVTMIRAQLQARHIIIHRSGMDSGVGVLTRQVNKHQGFLNHGLHMGSIPDLRDIGVTDVQEARDSEKKELQDLNERLANYIERVRFYEAQNRKMAAELQKLKDMLKGVGWSKIKEKYEVELEQARKLLDRAVKEKSNIEVSVASEQEIMVEMQYRYEFAQKDAADVKEKFERQNQQLSDLEAEVCLLRRRVASLENERDKEKELNSKLQEMLNIARSDLNSETLLHIDAESRSQSLEDELIFIKSVHEQELKELEALVYKDWTTDNRDYWKTEMGQALREIQVVFDDRMAVIRVEMETYYNFKLEKIQADAVKNIVQHAHFKEESARLREQLQRFRDKFGDDENKYLKVMRELEMLRREKGERERELEKSNGELTKQVITLQATIDAMIKEVKKICDTKHGHGLEILTYRRLLELEENRAGFRQLVNNESLETESSDSGYHHDEYIILESGTMPTDEFRQVVKSLVSYGEMHDKSTMEEGVTHASVAYTKEAKGSVVISECPLDGRNVVVENTGTKAEWLDNWSLTRDVTGKDSATYTFGKSTLLGPGQKIKIWGKRKRPSTWEKEDLEWDQTWEVGALIETKLINSAGEERAKFKQELKFDSNIVDGFSSTNS